jgi:cobalt-zinc-cadmium efflux system protein
VADDPVESPEKRKKPAPASVRIKGSEGSARVVATPVETVKARAPAPSEPAPSRDEPLGTPPLESGTLSGSTPSPPAEEVNAKRAKPPPPHASKPASQQRRVEPVAPSVPPPPPRPAEPSAVKVRVAPSRKPPEEPPAAPSAPASDPHEGAHDPHGAHPHEDLAPHLSTDQGRLSALSATISVVLLVFVIELYAGFASNSLALFSDAGHVFMDFFSYVIAYGAVVASQRKASERETFGAHRSEIVAAFLSGILLLLVVAGIWSEAAQRLFTQRALDLDLTYMLTVPWLSILANLYLSKRLSGGHDVNIRSAHMHVLSDLGSAAGVLLAGVLILATGNPIFDPAISMVIGFLIFVGAVRILIESGNILLERTPAHLNVKEIIERVLEVPGVRAIHSVHVWSLCSTVHALSAHLVADTAGGQEAQQVIREAQRRVEREFSIAFTTFQVEREDCGGEQHQSVTHSPADAFRHAHI